MRVAAIAAIVFCLVLQGVAHARPRRGYSNYSAPRTYSYTSSPELFNGSDQERCQAEANYMAANSISGHVGSCIGNFEGCGCGPTPDCGTCTPGGGMTLTGDGVAQGRNGMWYRVRSWR